MYHSHDHMRTEDDRMTKTLDVLEVGCEDRNWQATRLLA